MNFSESIKKHTITKVTIVDFDGTLANSPTDKPQSQEERDAVGWNGRDWWGNEASLPDGITFNEEVVKAFIEAKEDPYTHAVFMTGRRGIISHRVREILYKKGLVGKRIVSPTNTKALAKVTTHPGENEEPHPHDEYFCGDFITEPDYPTRPGKKGKVRIDDSTIAHKRYIIEKKLMNDNVKELHIWDDRSEHIPIFAKICRNMLSEWPNLKRAVIHRVYPPEGTNTHALIQHIPIK